MKNKLLFCCFLTFNSLLLYSQTDSTATFHIAKHKEFLYQGVDSTIQDWYFFIDAEKKAYMANLFIPKEEIFDWFLKRKNSNNIFKSHTEMFENDTIIYLSKENEPDIIMVFTIERIEQDIFLKSTENETIYHFRRINIQ